MARKNIIDDSLWDAYSNKVTQLMNNPKNQGEISQEEVDINGNKLIIADFGAESCGDAVRLYWEVNPKTDVIENAKFRSFGCGTAIASSDIMVELCINKRVQDAVKITNIDVEMALRDEPSKPAVPNQKMHCSVMAYDVIKKAGSIYLGVDETSFEEEIIVCECARVSLSTIRNAIIDNDLKSIEEITHYTKAGGYCKSCIRPGGHEKREWYLVDILRDTRALMEQEAISKAANSNTDDFETMTLVKKIKAIDLVIDKDIRQFLIMDGGDLEIVDVKEGGESIDIYVRYLGACSSCSSSATGTLFAIESALQEKLSSKIRVLPI